MIELTVILKDEERTYKQKFLVYERIDLWHDSEIIKSYIKQAEAGFKAQATDVQIKVSMHV